MTVEDAIRQLTEVVKGSDESPETEVTYIEAPANPSDGDTLTYDATSGKWVAGAPQSGGLSLKYIFFDIVETTEDDSTYYAYIADSNNNTSLDSDVKDYFNGACLLCFVFRDPNNTGRGFGETPYYYMCPNFMDYPSNGCKYFETPVIGLANEMGVFDSMQIDSVMDEATYTTYESLWLGIV